MSLHVFPDSESTRSFVEGLAVELRRPCVITLSGELGAGKTQFVRWFLQALKAAEASSPTFSVHNVYASPSGPVDHVDLYRLTSDADLESSGFWDLLSGAGRLVFVEWADRLPDSVWPANFSRVDLKIKKISEQGREVSCQIRKP